MSVKITIEYLCECPGCFEKGTATSNKASDLRENLWSSLEAKGWVHILGRDYCPKDSEYPSLASKGMRIDGMAQVELDVMRNRQRDTSRDK